MLRHDLLVLQRAVVVQHGHPTERRALDRIAFQDVDRLLDLLAVQVGLVARVVGVGRLLEDVDDPVKFGERRLGVDRRGEHRTVVQVVGHVGRGRQRVRDFLARKRDRVLIDVVEEVCARRVLPRVDRREVAFRGLHGGGHDPVRVHGLGLRRGARYRLRCGMLRLDPGREGQAHAQNQGSGDRTGHVLLGCRHCLLLPFRGGDGVTATRRE